MPPRESIPARPGHESGSLARPSVSNRTESRNPDCAATGQVAETGGVLVPPQHAACLGGSSEALGLAASRIASDGPTLAG